MSAQTPQKTKMQCKYHSRALKKATKVPKVTLKKIGQAIFSYRIYLLIKCLIVALVDVEVHIKIV